MKKDVAVIGSGPAGLTAAIYLLRAGIQTTIFAGETIGGQLTKTTDIENFPGFVNGINGGELVSNMLKQAQRFGAITKYTSVDCLLKTDHGKIVVISDKWQEDFDAVIIATGSTPKYLNIPNEDKWLGNGYHTCATCDGFFYKGKTVAVVGGGDTAMEDAHYLSGLAKKVYVIHRSDKFKASKIMLERVKSLPNVEFLTNKIVIGFIEEENSFKGVMLTQTDCPFQNATREDLQLDALFVAIGHTPNSDFVEGILTRDNFGYLIPKTRTMSEIPGIFIAGDVGDNYYRQAITAAGDGCKAAIDCDRWLNK